MISRDIANRYAKALYQVFNSKESFVKDLDQVVNLYMTVQDFREFLTAPQIKREDQESLLKKFFYKESEPQFFNFLRLLLNKGRIKDLPAIAKAYKKIIAKESKTVEATMITAIRLEDSLKKKVQAMLEKTFQKKVTLEEEVDRKIIGGMILLIDNQMLDVSIKRELATLKNNLLKATS